MSRARQFRIGEFGIELGRRNLFPIHDRDGLAFSLFGAGRRHQSNADGEYDFGTHESPPII